MNDHYITVFFYSKLDSFSRQILSELNNLNIDRSQIERISVDCPVAKSRLYQYKGDISIPVIFVKDADGIIESISGSKLLNWVRSMAQQAKMIQTQIPQQGQVAQISMQPSKQQKHKHQQGGTDLSDIINDPQSGGGGYQTSLEDASGEFDINDPPVKESDETGYEFQQRLTHWHEGTRKKQLKKKGKREGSRGVDVSEVMSHDYGLNN